MPQANIEALEGPVDHGDWLTLGAIGLLAAGGVARHGSRQRAPGCIELFAGAGGVALGLQAAGFATRAYVEKSPHAAATLRAAVAQGRLHGDVLEADVREVDYALYAGIDAFWSSFPCPTFSRAGHRQGTTVERGQGWSWSLEAIDETNPTWVMAENVTGLRDFPLHRQILADLTQRYAWADSWELNAADFGVPQSRKRLFFVAGPGPVQRPSPSHAAWSQMTQGLPPHRSLLQALDYDPWARLDRFLQLRSRGHQELPWAAWESALATRYGARWPEIQDAYEVVDYRCTVCKVVLSEPQAGMCHCPGPVAAQDVLSVPAPTLAGGSQRSHVSGRSLLAGAAKRDKLMAALSRHTGGFTVAEAALLQGFPEDWPFSGSNQWKYRQIANAVPPPLAYAVGRAVREAMG